MAGKNDKKVGKRQGKRQGEKKAGMQIIFNSAEHRNFYHEMIKKSRVNDSYHRAFFYVMGISPDTRRNIRRLFDFEMDCVNLEGLRDGWQTSGSVRVCHMAFNLWNGYMEDGNERAYTPDELFCRGYAPYFMEGIKIRYLDYCRDFYSGERMAEARR